MGKNNPSVYLNRRPMASVFSRSEEESVAYYLIKMLAKTGNEWREISWDEFKESLLTKFTDKINETPKWWWDKKRRAKLQEQREKALASLIYNHELFLKVAPYCVSEEKAKTFSPSWADIHGQIKKYGSHLELKTILGG